MKGSGSNKPKDFPVFVSTQKLEFIAKLANTHKQILTIYNIYNTSIAFSILSTHPNHYIVRESKGVIQKQCCVDVLIRAQDFRSLTEDSPVAKHRLRIQLHSQSGSSVIGYRDVDCVLRLDEPLSSAAQSGAGQFVEPVGVPSPLSSATGGSSLPTQRRFDNNPTLSTATTLMPGATQAPLPLGFTLSLAVVCVSLLAMPLYQGISSEESAAKLQEHQQQQQSQSYWLWTVNSLSNLSVSHHVKLVAAYVLGLLTVALFRY